MTSRRIQVIAAALLLCCMLSPFVEMAWHSSDSIFSTGSDMESTVALLLLTAELAVAFTNLLVACVCRVRRAETPVNSDLILEEELFAVPPPHEFSPPLPLRI